MLVGREQERARLATLVDQARQGLAGAVVVHGEPGVGKSALLDELEAGTPDARVLRAQGVEGEAPLAFAALHRLLLPVSALRPSLPEPQAHALRVAFGEEYGEGVEPFLVALATLSLLTGAAEGGLVLCVVDDAHWLDEASADALLFVARRLGADRVAMLFGARDDAVRPFRPAGVPDLALEGLDPAAARTLLAQREGVAPDDGVAARLLAETGGNPLALLELPLELSPAQLAGSTALPTLLPLSHRVEQSFLDRSRRLPPGAQDLVLLAAADPSADLALIRRAGAILGVDEPAVEAAFGSGLLQADREHVWVRHSLVRSAIYQAAGDDRRRRAHLALADALRDGGDPDRETWHRALAADGPADDLAAELARVAAKAERRGAFVTAVDAYERAARLTPDGPDRAARTFAAARNAWASGQAPRARLLLEDARQTENDPVLTSDLARLRGRIEVNLGSAVDAHRIFVEAAHAVHTVDPLRALEMATAAAVMRTFGSDSGATLVPGELSTDPTSEDTPRTRCLRQVLLSMTCAADERWPEAVAALPGALEAGEAVDDLDVIGNLGNAALQVGDHTAQQHFYSLMLALARERGAAMSVVYALQRLCFGHLVAGDWAAVRGCAEEALALATSLGQPGLTVPSRAWLTLLAALQGRDEYDALLARLEDLVAAHPLGILTDPVHDLTRWAKGARAAGAGDPAGALHHLSRFRLPAVARMAAVDRAEAAVRADRPDLARAWADELAPFANGTARPWALAALELGYAVAADPAEAEEHFLSALAHGTQAGHGYDRARLHLAYGEWLRRHQRRVDARVHLRTAVETFGDLQAQPWVDRATRELRASGETARKRDPSTLLRLTPMELKIAQLVSSGLSNKDAAAQCWVSPRTVAFHLRNVFTKTGVTSRGELAQLDLG